MYNIGWGVPQDYTEAMKWFRKAADQGYAEVQNSLGTMYYSGEGVPQDYTEAMKWFRKAADQGHARAQSSLGEGYKNGQSLSRDYVQAHKWFNLAASKLTGIAREIEEKNRNNVAANMTPAQIAEAQRLATEWQLTTPKP